MTRPRNALLAPVLFAVVSACEAPPVRQPIAFNHEIHVGKRGIPCTDCHVGARTGARATLPPITRCLLCHMKPQGDGPNEREQVVREIALAGHTLEWDQALRLPDHVYFSHVRHVVVARLDCLDCHADMPHRTSPPPERRVVSRSEGIACHEEFADRPAARRATVDCAACHR